MAPTSALRAETLFNCRGYVAIVTGGGTGIGLMAAQTMAANGAKVYIVGRREEALEKAQQAHNPDTGGEITPCNPCDVTKKEEIQRLVEEISAKEKYVNVLITAAGISGPRGSPDSQDADRVKANLWDNETVEQWNEVYNYDVTSVYFTTVAFLPLLQEAAKKYGHMSASVITISSMSGMMMHAQGHFSYNAAKGGTIQLTKLMCGEFQKAGIRVNSIAPGYFPSEMTTKESDENQKSEMSKEKVQNKGHVPIERPGSDEDIAKAVLFFAKNEFVNGEITAVDGGVMTVVAGR